MPRRGPSIAVPFVGGLDTKTDTKMTPMGSFQVLENGVFSDHGTIKKRWGYDAKILEDMNGGALAGEGLPWHIGGAAAGYRSPITGLAHHGGSLLLTTQREIFSWGEPQGKWVEQGECPDISVSVDEVPNVVGQQTMGDSISNGVITAHIWEDSRSTGVRASIVDTTTGFVHVYDYSLDTAGSIPRCGLAGDSVLLFWLDTTANTIECVAITNGDPAASIAATPEVIVSSIAAADTYDVVTSQGRTWVAAITADLEIHEVNSSGVSFLSVSRDVATEFSLTISTITHLAAAHVYGTGGPDGSRTVDVVGLNSAGTAGFWTEQYDDNLTDANGQVYTISDTGTVKNVALVQALGLSADNDNPFVVYEVDGGDDWDDRVVIDAAQSGSEWATIQHAGLASRGVLIGDSGHVVLVHTSPGLQHCYFLYDIIPAKPVARFAYGNAAGSYNKGQLPGLWSSDGVNFGFSALMRRRISSLGQAFEADNADASTFENTELGHYTFTLGAGSPSVEVGGATYLPKGTLLSFDGVQCEESAPTLFPEDVVLSDVAGGSNIAEGATYLYRVYYERVRANGETTRSLALTFATDPISAASRKVRLVVPTLSHTMAQAAGDWRIAIYRTEANKTRFFHQVTNPDLTDITGSNRYLANDVTVATLTFDDDMSDAVLVKKKLDPQTQGDLPVVQPGAASIIGEAGDRIYLAGGEYKKGVVAPSMLHFPGEPVLFSDELQFTVEEEGGDITAMGAIDGVLVVFTERRVYAVSGQGPDNTGGSTGSFNVQRVTTDVGCTDPGSVVETPAGLMFKSAKGLYIISRSFDTEYIGWPVELFNEQSIVSAEVIPDTNLVVFLTSSGNTPAYDYFYKKWTTFTGHAGVDAVAIGDDYHYLRSDGEVYTRNTAAFLDAGSWYALRLRTAPIRLDSVQDYLRVRRLNLLGEYLSSHRLQMKVFNNRDPFPFETRIFEPDDVIDLTLWGDADLLLWGDADTELWGGTPGDTDYQLQHKFKRQKVQYFRLEFKDIQTTGAPGQSYELAEMNFEIGIYDGNARIPAARKL